MESRPYFLLGDILSNTVAGAVVAVVCVSVFDGSWPSLPAMMLGMVLGTLVAMPLAMAASIAFGAFEVLLPVMTTGMLVGMLGATRSAPLGQAAMAGALVGLGVLFLSYGLNSWARRHEATWTL